MLLLCAQPQELGTPANCCPAPSCSLEFQTKSAAGGATLCGYSEYTSPSSPPKKYRSQSQGGGYVFKHYTDLTCATPAANPDLVCNWSGACLYDADDCTFDGSGGTQDCGGGPAGNCGNLGGDFADGSPDVDMSPTLVAAKVTGTCRTGGAGQGKYTTANQYKQLLDEDTEDRAIQRADLTEGSWTPCTPSSPGDCSAYKELRGAGVFNLGYRTCQVRYQASAGVSGVEYNASITLAKRVQGSSDPFVDFGELTHQHIGTGMPYTSDWLTIPADSGYEVIATACTITIGT